MRTLFEITAVFLFAASITRLVAADTLTRRARVRVAWWVTHNPKYVERDTWCRWCVSFWTSLPIAWAWWQLSPTPHLFGNQLVDVLVLALGLRYAIGFTATWED